MLKSRRNKHLTADRAVFSGIATANQPALSMSRSLLGLVFSSDGWALSGSAFTLSLGTSGIDASGETSGTNIISSKLSIGTGTNIWKVGTSRHITDRASCMGAGVSDFSEQWLRDTQSFVSRCDRPSSRVGGWKDQADRRYLLASYTNVR
jgi:hypothetical protein